MLIGLIEALAAATAYGVATVAQSIGVARMSDAPRAGLLAAVRAGWLYGAGLGLDLLGLLASVAALHTLPLFFVESAVASSVGITAAVVVMLTGVRLSKIETTAVITMLIGLFLLGGSAQPGRAESIGSDGQWWLLAGAVVLAAATWLTFRRRGAAIALACLGGLGFAIVGIASRVLQLPSPWWHIVEDPTAWALAIAGAVGTVAFGAALVNASATTVAAITFAVETVVPSLIGLSFLGDAVRPHLHAVALVGFAATLAGCISLARMADGEAALARRRELTTS